MPLDASGVVPVAAGPRVDPSITGEFRPGELPQHPHDLSSEVGLPVPRLKAPCPLPRALTLSSATSSTQTKPLICLPPSNMTGGLPEVL